MGTTAETFSKIETLIQLVDNENKEVYILGDLNCNLLDSNILNVKASRNNATVSINADNDQPTRVTQSTKSILDVCITSSPDKIIQSGAIHLGISDHSLIYAPRKLNYVFKRVSRNSVEFRNFKKFNVESFIND